MRPLEIVEACWRAEESKDVSGILALYRPDAVWTSGTIRLEGREAIGAMYRDAASSDVRISIGLRSHFETGDDIAVEWTATLTHDGSVIAEIEGFNAVRTDGSAIRSLRAYLDPSPSHGAAPASD